MIITRIQTYRYSIPMVPFVIATGTMHVAQNMLVVLHTNEGLQGWGECSAFPMIVGETQDTCLHMGQRFAQAWLGKNTLELTARIQDLHTVAAYNYTAKSAFDMALYDVLAQHSGKPLYAYLNAKAQPKTMVTDLTIGIDTPDAMAAKAIDFVAKGVQIIKVKLGKNAQEDIARIAAIRAAIGYNTTLRIDANQGWSFEDAVLALQALEPYQIEFCEQPMHRCDDYRLTALQQQVSIPIMADESVFTSDELKQFGTADGFASVNIKLAKSGGIFDALAIVQQCEKLGKPNMMGGMLESRLAFTAFAHLATACDNIKYYDMDTPMLGHLVDPVVGGAFYKGFEVHLPQGVHGIGATVNSDFLAQCDLVTDISI